MPNFEFLCYPEEIKPRFVLLSGGRGSGKSHGMGEAFVYYTFDLPDRSTLIVGQKHYNKIGKASFKNIKDKIFDMGLQDCFKFKQSPYEITNLETNTMIGFVGLDNEDSLKSIEDVTYMWMEEANQITADGFRTINLSLRNEGTIIFLTWNPISPYDYTEENFIQNEHRIDGEHYIHVHSTYLDNPFLPDDFNEEMEILKKHNPKVYKRDGLGLPIPHEGIIFENFEVEEFDYSGVQTVLGRDFGFNDADVVAECWINASGEVPTLYICNELYLNGDEKLNQGKSYTNLDCVAHFQNSTLYKPNKELICERDPDKVQEMNRINGINAIGVNKHHILKKHQLEIMQGWKIVIHPQCKHTIKEISVYSWAKDKRTGIMKDEPEDGNDHCMDAIRYSISKTLYALVKNSALRGKYIRGL
jgi:phage terminase large subunit